MDVHSTSAHVGPQQTAEISIQSTSLSRRVFRPLNQSSDVRKHESKMFTFYRTPLQAIIYHGIKGSLINTNIYQVAYADGETS